MVEQLLVFTESNVGFCRFYYKHPDGRKFCMQEDRGGVFVLKTIHNKAGEPDYQIGSEQFKFQAVPEINDYHKQFNDFLRRNDLMYVSPDDKFENLVREMRLAQKNYFKTRQDGWLRRSKQLELAVDMKLSEKTDGKQGRFSV